MRYIILILIIYVLKNSTAKLGDPYSVLEIERDASQQEIKKAFKKLAREWHPDKNSSPGAEDHFVKISEAYKLLSDAERRRLYDTTGQTEESPSYRRSPDQGSSRHFDPFDDIFSGFGGAGGGFRFTYREEGINFYAKKSITKRTYESVVIPGSRKQPFVLLFYSDWCVACAHIEPIWRRLVDELEPINFGMNTVHAGRETELSRKLGVKTVPYLVLLLDGHPYHYTQPSLSMASSLDFIKSKFPHKLVQRVTEENIQEFLGGWIDNQVRVLLFGRLDIIRLRYLTVAWEFRQRVVVGYVQMGRADTDSIRDRHRVSSKVDTLLVFHEDASTPVASVAMTDLPYPTIKDIIEANKFLMLPRLSSQTVLDALCPVESVHSRRRLCVVLVTQDSPLHDPSRASLRDYSLTDQFRERDRLRYTYIFRDKQVNFVNALTAGAGSPEASDLHIVIIWRRDRKHLSYEWVSHQWKVTATTTAEGGGGGGVGAGQQNESKEALRDTIRKLLYTNEPMPFETEIQELFDEHAQSIVWRVINRLSNFQDYLRDRITTDDLVPAISVLATLLFILIGGYVMSYLVKLEEDRINEKANLSSSTSSSNPSASSSSSKLVRPQLKIHELRGETYNGLIRLMKPGCRTLVLLCDTEAKAKLTPKFHKAAWPYRKNKTLMFAFLNTDRHSGMDWYKRILTLGLPEPRELNINPKNTIGTVLSLNGHRKYYCIYHAKHPEDLRGSGGLSSFSSDMAGLRRRGVRSGASGDFMGFSDSDSESDVEVGSRKKESVASDKPLLNYYSNILFEDQLLDGLTNWMDRLFEGTTHRYYINYWPEWPGK